MMRKGSITVFLTGLLLVFTSFVLVCVAAVRRQVIRIEGEGAFYQGLDSIFAEYNRELLDKYDLFFIDSSYGGTQASYHNTEAHLFSYVRDNLRVPDEVVTFDAKDFLGIEAQEVTISQAAFATDDYGKDVKYQAIEYVRDLIGLELIEDIQGQMQTVTGNEMDTRDMEQEAAEVQAQIDGTPLPDQTLDDGSVVPATVDNPADEVNGSRFEGILSLVVAEQSRLSTKGITLSNYASERPLAQGTGPACPKASFSVIDEIFFGEYLLRKCGNFRTPNESGKLEFELEYILGGKDSDMENLRWVAGRLIMMREVSNTLYIYSDSEKVLEAEALAWGLAIVTLQPSIQPFIKNSILLAWAYAESVLDVRHLLSGKKVPLLKSKDTWCLSLSHMLEYALHMGDTSGSDEGLTYEEYLRILLLLENANKKSMRFIDVIEMNLRNTEGNENFYMDGCMDMVTAGLTISGGFGENFSYTASYSYLNR